MVNYMKIKEKSEKYDILMNYLVQEGSCPCLIGLDVSCLGQEESNGKMENGWEVGSCGHCWNVKVINKLKERKNND